MTRLVALSSRRFLMRHPLQILLAVTGVAAGVAVVVGVDLANASAERAFVGSAELVSGRATHQLIAPGDRVPESLYAELRTRQGIRHAAPVVEAGIGIAGSSAIAVTLLGLDPLAEPPFRGFLTPAPNDGALLSRLLTEPRVVVLPLPLAERLAVEAGDVLDLAIGGRRVTVEVAGIVAPNPARAAFMANLVLTDISIAQELLGLEGSLSRIDLILNAREAEALASNLGSTAELVPAAARQRALVEMTRAFRTNLTALSLLALLVGALLIYSTMSFLVVRRRRLFGLLRAVGLSRSQLFRQVMAEAALIGSAGTGAGLVLGVLLGGGLVSLVTRTIDELYIGLPQAALWFDSLALAKGAALGLAISVLASLAPAREAANAAPRALLSRASMEARMHARQPALVWAAAGATVLAVAALVIFPDRLAPAFFALFCIILAAVLVTPVATAGLMMLLRPVMARLTGVAGSLAARGVVAGLSRTGVAVAALAVAVSALVGIGIMIASFRHSVTDWLETTLRADFYVSADTAAGAEADDELAVRAAALPGVIGVSRTRRARLRSADGELRIWAIDPGPSDWRPRFVAGDPEAAWVRFRAGEAVLVSEPLARRRNLAVGERLRLASRRSWPIAGVFVDYTTDQGVVALSLDAWRAHFRDPALSGLGIYAASDVDPAALRRELSQIVASRPGLQLASSHEVRAASLKIFDQTFTITEVLRVLAGTVALLGIYSALQALMLERRREIAILRSVGFTPADVRRHVLVQTGLLGLAAAVVALPLGVVLAWVLVRIINERAFGWSMTFELAPAALWQGAALALGAALLAGLQPAFALARQAPAVDLREE
ncbi:ABC transporter permease [soil metagenome]